MMIRKKFRQKTFLLCCIVFFGCAVCLSLFNVFATAVEFEEDLYENSYIVGDTVEFPDITITAGGNRYVAEKQVIFPNGTAKMSDEETLLVSGFYTVRYTVRIDGKAHRKEYGFVVNNSLFSVERASASATYDSDKGAILATLDNKNKFVYNDVIDLSDNTAKLPLLELYNIASVDGQKDFGQIVIILSDLQNPSNCIYIRINEADGFGQYEYGYHTSYVAVSIGNENSYKGKDGARIHVNDRYGTPVRFSYCNMGYNGALPEHDRIQLFYDSQERQIYAYSTSASSYGGLVVDFDSSDFYNEFWEGFSDNKCRLSLFATSMHKDKASIYITSIDGQDLTRQNTVDETGPEIIVDVPETINRGVVGFNYKIFDYSTQDDNGVVSAYTEVYYNYYSANPIIVSSTNGIIKTNYTGKYTICYNAIDTYGNKSVKTVDFSVDSAAKASPLEITVNGDYADCLAGEIVDLIDFEVSADNKYGDYMVSVTAVCGDISIAVNGDTFRPIKVGKWTVTYTATDALGRTSSKSKTFNAAINTTPVFTDGIGNLPKYFISGKTYDIPTVKAYSYGNNVSSLNANALYILNGIETTITDGKITPIATSAGVNIVRLVYYVDGNQIFKEIPVINALDNRNLDMAKLFYTTDGIIDSVKSSDGITFTATGDADMDFVNDIIAGKFSLEFSFASNLACYAEFVLTDTINDAEKLIFRFDYTAGAVRLSLNGNHLLNISRANIIMSLSGNILIVNATTFNIKTFLSGALFDGFDSNKVSVQVKMRDSASLKISKITNQPLSSHNEDVILPMMVTVGVFESYFKKGDVANIPYAISCDAVSGSGIVTVTARLDGEYLKTADGREINNLVVTENMTVVLDRYGTCYLNYRTTDLALNPFNMTRVLYVLDDIKPEFNPIGDIKSEVSLDTELTLPSVSATDNLTENIEVSVLTINPDCSYKVISGNTVTFNKVGKWTIRFFAIDEAGNINYVDKIVMVKEKV